MEVLKQMRYKQIDEYFLEILKYKKEHNEFWCGYFLATLQNELINALNKGIITSEENNYLNRCGRYAAIIM